MKRIYPPAPDPTGQVSSEDQGHAWMTSRWFSQFLDVIEALGEKARDGNIDEGQCCQVSPSWKWVLVVLGGSNVG